MNTVAATQPFAGYGSAILHSGRQELPTNQPVSLPSTATNTDKQTTTIMPDLRKSLANIAETKQITTATGSAESTSSAVQNEDNQSYNPIAAVDAVERILDQLSTGKLLSWIDGSSHEKIQAQLTERQRPGTGLMNNLPAFSAQSVARSFGLDNSAALLDRIARSGIFGQTPMTAAAQAHVDLNI